MTRRGQVSALNIQDVLEHFEWIEGYQLMQPNRDKLVVRLLTRVDPTEERLLPVRSRLRTQLGDLSVTFERVNELSRRPNGKIELVASALGAA
jgi:hypothetical protein